MAKNEWFKRGPKYKERRKAERRRVAFLFSDSALALARAVSAEQSRYTIEQMARRLLRMAGEKI